MDYLPIFNTYCQKNDLDLQLSFVMPEGYETANGTLDPVTKTVFINANLLELLPDHEKLFYFFHELRHAAQYLHPEQFDELTIKSRFYVIMYNGICYKLTDDEWKECQLEGTEEFFTELYLGQSYERDANTFAYDMTKSLLGDSRELQELYAFWMPKKPVPEAVYTEIYRKIDENIDN